MAPVLLQDPVDTSETEMLQAAIKFDKVSRAFVTNAGQDVQALRDLSFSVGKNEFLAIVGPSGCGKSTILRLTAGLLSPSQGHVSIYGAPVTEPPDMVGIVFQKPTLLPWLDIAANVVFPMRHKFGRVTEDDRRQARDLLSLVGLGEFARSRPDELSGGMQQRAAIARALLLDPEILLMDEPFSALDALTRDEMAYELLRIWTERPKTVVFITHSIPEAVLLSDRIIVMTSRPGTVAEVVDIPIERPRSIHTLIDQRYGEITAHIRSMIFNNRRAA
jgi:NitT/TauT family transport system ATP-binding protein